MRKVRFEYETETAEGTYQPFLAPREVTDQTVICKTLNMFLPIVPPVRESTKCFFEFHVSINEKNHCEEIHDIYRVN